MAWTANVLAYVRATNGVTPFTGSIRANDIDFPQSQASVALANGTGAAQIDLAWGDQRSYTTSNTVHDVTALAETSANTGAATFSVLKYMQAYNGSSVDTMVVGGAASTCVNLGYSSNTVTFTIQPLGHVAFFNPTASGWTTTSANNLKIISGANTVTGTVILLGED